MQPDKSENQDYLISTCNLFESQTWDTKKAVVTAFVPLFG